MKNSQNYPQRTLWNSSSHQILNYSFLKTPKVLFPCFSLPPFIFCRLWKVRMGFNKSSFRANDSRKGYRALLYKLKIVLIKSTFGESVQILRALFGQGIRSSLCMKLCLQVRLRLASTPWVLVDQPMSIYMYDARSHWIGFARLDPWLFLRPDVQN